jgi:hypothetical protein
MSQRVNPYIVGSPIKGSAMFFGREDVFAFIQQSLAGQHRDNVIVLYGQRRTGKTSVLYQLRTHLDPRYLCILTDLHSFALEGLGGFLWELANHIGNVLARDYHIELPALSEAAFAADPRRSFNREFLDHVWATIGDRHILLMLDETTRLQEQVRAGKLEREVFEYLRHLMEHYERLNFLFSLGSSLQEMEKEYAFLFSVGLYKKISFLDPDATRALITQPIKDEYQVELGTIERIFAITSGHPYFTQLLCHCLFNRWQQRLTPSIAVEHVDEILDEAVERGLGVLKYVWDEATPGEKAVMASMAASLSNPGDRVGIDAISRAWTANTSVIPRGEIAKAIKGLIARDVITGGDQYAFAVDLQRLWVQKHRRMEWVEEEIADAVQAWASPPAPAIASASRPRPAGADREEPDLAPMTPQKLPVSFPAFPKTPGSLAALPRLLGTRKGQFAVVLLCLIAALLVANTFIPILPFFHASPRSAASSQSHWTVVPSPSPGRSYNHLFWVTALNASNIWAVGYYINANGDYRTLTEQWNGTGWTTIPSASPGQSVNVLFAVTTVPGNPNLAWAVGAYLDPNNVYQTLIEQWFGTQTWNVVASPNVGSALNGLRAVDALSANDIWAVGQYQNAHGRPKTLIEHWDGISWSIVPSPSPGSFDNDLRGLAAISAHDIWAVGYFQNFGGPRQTLIEQWNGTSWSVVPSPNPGTSLNYLRGVAAISAHDVWVTGYDANANHIERTLIEQWDGTHWCVVASPSPGKAGNTLESVTALSANNIWAVGYANSSSSIYRALIEHWNGASWQIASGAKASAAISHLYYVTQVPHTSALWAVGDYASISSGPILALTEQY